MAIITLTSVFHLYLVLFIYFDILIMLLQLAISPPSLHSILPTTSLPHPRPIVHVHGSYLEVLWLLHFLHYSYPPPVYFVPTIYASYSLYLSPYSPPPFPPDNPPGDVQFCDSVPLLVVCLVCFCFCFYFRGGC